MRMISPEDIARVAVTVAGLKQVVIVSTPDCLTVRSWARVQRADDEGTAASLGNLFMGGIEALRQTGSGAQPMTLTVESEDALLVIARLSRDMVGCFVFDRSAPLGLIRVQVRQLSEHIKQSISDSLPPSERQPKERPSSIPPVAALPLRSQPSPSASGTEDLRPPQWPRGARLIELLKRRVPDAHAALLRLSLRTGISVEALDHADRLDDSQVELVEASVRDILGHEQLSV
jgi:predicted regulator of Ras-like GTPase activity (Roadblock/LC7/MglB family)